MLKDTAWKPSIVVGTILQAFGVVLPILWVLDYINVIRPASEPMNWPIIIFMAALFGFGTLLVKGKGDSIAEVFMNMLKKKGL